MSSLTVLLFGVVLLGAAVTDAADCGSTSGKTGPPNNFPVIDTDPVFLRSVPNGDLYQVGSPTDVATGGAYTFVLHLHGSSSYHFGFATGSLLKTEVLSVLNTAWAYFKSEVEMAINGTANKYHLSQKIIDWIATVGLEAALDIQNDIAAPFISKSIYDEMRGLADSSGASLALIRRIHMVGELTRGRCSFYGAFGSSTADSHVLQLRALDWDTSAGLQNFPVVTFYHPTPGSGLGNPFVNVGWAGWIGVLTGGSSKGIAISEIGIDRPDYPPAFGDETSTGLPFIFLMREIVQRQASMVQAKTYIEGANRTCRLLLCVADANAQSAMAVQYSHSIVRFFSDKTLEPLAPWHPRIPDVVYEGMDWKCPFFQSALHRQLSFYHGRLTPELSISNVTANVKTGDLHAAVFDLTANVLFVANHAPNLGNISNGVYPPAAMANAYSRPWIRLDLKVLFALAKK